MCRWRVKGCTQEFLPHHRDSLSWNSVLLLFTVRNDIAADDCVWIMSHTRAFQCLEGLFGVFNIHEIVRKSVEWISFPIVCFVNSEENHFFLSYSNTVGIPVKKFSNLYHHIIIISIMKMFLHFVFVQISVVFIDIKVLFSFCCFFPRVSRLFAQQGNLTI